MITRNSRIRVSSQASKSFSLHINDVQESDGGYYSCQVCVNSSNQSILWVTEFLHVSFVPCTPHDKRYEDGRIKGGEESERDEKNKKENIAAINDQIQMRFKIK